MADIGRILNILDRDGALELEPLSGEWPEIPAGSELFHVDWGRLLPNSPPRRGDGQGEPPDDDRWQLPPDLVDEIAKEARGDRGLADPPGWDVWAWYQPIHFFGPDWGIFIKEQYLIEGARRVARQFPFLPCHPVPFAKGAIRAAFSLLFLHEQYHHKIESFAIRLHVVGQHPVYPAYHRGVYRRARGTDAQIEEGLANADSWKRLATSPYSPWLGAIMREATRAYLDHAFLAAPPGYRNATRLLAGDFNAEQHLLFAQVQEATPSPTRLDQADFAVASHIHQSLFRISQEVWTIVPAGVPSVLPSTGAVAPVATRKLDRLVRRKGFDPVAGGGKGGHQKYRDADGRMVILRSEKDVSRPVLKSTAATLEISVRALEEAARAA